MAEFTGIDFTKRRKDAIVFTLPVEAGSDEGFEISVLPPTKRTYDALQELASVVDKWSNGDLEADDFDMGAMLGAVADAMSHNSQMRKVTAEYLESIGFDLSDIADFTTAYLFFLMRLVDEKNSSAPGPTRETEAQGEDTATR